MGKSGKKIKSDRINTLRKQYDAFLEDDKNRKDRNEYILGRLEEMRSSAALVKINYKANAHVQGECFSSRGIPDYLNDPSRMERNVRNYQSKITTPSDCLTKQFESSILKEISKNYILIPKLQPCLSSGLTYHSPPLTANNDADWKSKYNILNELKKSEKESIPDKVNDFILEENHKAPFSSDESENKQQNKINNDIADNVNTPKYELNQFQTNFNTIEKDLTGSSATDYEFRVEQDNAIPQIEIPNKHISHNLEPYKNDRYEPTTDNVIQKIEVSQQQYDEPNSEIKTNNEIYNSVENHSIPKETTNMDMNQIENQWKGKGDEDFDNESFKKNKSEHFNQEIKEEISYTEKIDPQHLKDDDINSSGEFQENSKDYVDKEPEFNNIQKLDSHEAPMNSDQNANVKVNELEKEQNEMFYTENSEKKYEYDESNVDTAGNPVENYTNEQYPYYDESQHEQQYTTEINEHEESTERYDPNYEQQYAENYENVPQYNDQQYDVDNSYETQQNPVESTVNYEEVQPSNDIFEPVQTENMDSSYQNQDATEYNLENESYEAQHYETNEQQEYSTTIPNDQDQYAIDQEYNQINTEQETVQEMEQVLDREDGYIDNQNIPLNDDIQEPISANVTSIKNESSLKVS